jgi:hypothetical protein
MKTTRFLLPCLALLSFGVLSAGSAEDESALRKFTDQGGRTIEAHILAGTPDTVTIEMADGKSHTVPITKFSELDQIHIREWIKANPDARPYKFELTEVAKRLGKERRESASYEVTEESWNYELTIKNRSGFDVGFLDVRYRIFSSVPNTSDAGGLPKITTSDGLASIASLRNNGDIELKTDPVSLLESRLTTGSEFTDGSDIEKKQGLDGIWVKLFHDGKNVAEFKAGTDIVKKAEWSDEDALAVEGDINDRTTAP